MTDWKYVKLQREYWSKMVCFVKTLFHIILFKFRICYAWRCTRGKSTLTLIYHHIFISIFSKMSDMNRYGWYEKWIKSKDFTLHYLMVVLVTQGDARMENRHVPTFTLMISLGIWEYALLTWLSDRKTIPVSGSPFSFSKNTDWYNGESHIAVLGAFKESRDWLDNPYQTCILQLQTETSVVPSRGSCQIRRIRTAERLDIQSL